LVNCASAADPGPANVTVCASNLAGDCCGLFTDTIQVKFCPGTGGASDFYVYQLKNVPFCDMAYCAVEVSNTPAGPKYSTTMANIMTLLFGKD